MDKFITTTQVIKKVQLIKQMPQVRISPSEIQTCTRTFDLHSPDKIAYVLKDNLKSEDIPTWCKENDHIDSLVYFKIIYEMTTHFLILKKVEEECERRTFTLNKKTLEYSDDKFFAEFATNQEDKLIFVKLLIIN